MAIKKILVMTGLYPPYFIGGHEIQTQVLIDGLARRGYEVFVLTSRYGIAAKEKTGNVWRYLHYLPDCTAVGMKRRIEQAKLVVLSRLNYALSKKMLRRIRPDIVICGELSGISLFSLKAVPCKEIKVIHDLGIDYLAQLAQEGLGSGERVKKSFRRLLYGMTGIEGDCFDHLITNSLALKNQHIVAGFPAKNISVIPRGIDVDDVRNDYARASLEAKKHIGLLFVGRLCEEKGPQTAIDALRKAQSLVQDRAIHLDIVGEGDKIFVDKLLDQIGRLNLKESVRFLGRQTRARVFEEYRTHDVLLVPSQWQEPFANVILEAMSQGLPVIATGIGGIPEIIIHEENGLLIPLDKMVNFAEAIVRLIRSPALYENISKNGLSCVREKYTNEKRLDRFESYMKNVFGASQS